MPIGAGLAPAGLAAAGYGVPDTTTIPNNACLPDPLTGLPQTGRLLDPITKDYVFTADGRLQGTPTSRQLMQLAVRTTLGSSASPTLGMDMSGVSEKGGDYSRRVASAVSSAVAPIVQRGLVTVNSVTIQDAAQSGAPDATIATVLWTDNMTGQQFTEVLGS